MKINLRNILETNDYNNYIKNLYLNIFLSIFEFLSVLSIPLFITALIKPEFFYTNLAHFPIISLLQNLQFSKLVIFLSIFIILIFLIKNLLILLFISLEQKCIKNAKVKLLNRLYNFYVNAPYILHLDRNPETLSRIISRDINYLAIYMSSISALLRDTIALIVVFLILFFTSPKITSITLLFFITTSFFYNKKIKPIIKSRSQKNIVNEKKLIQIINETFFGIRDLKTMSKEKDVIRTFNQNQEEVARNTYIFEILQKVPKIAFETIIVTLLSIITLLFVNLNQNYSEALPKICLFAVCAFRFIPAFNSLILSRTYLRISMPYLTSLNREINFEKNYDYSSFNKNLDEKNFYTNKNNKIVSLQKINFTYPSNGKTSLKNISFDIDKSCTLGITGATGAGKSTLFYIMLGLIRPDSGIVFHYEKNIFNNLELWRKKIGYISQNIFLLDASIKSNITFDFMKQKVDEKRLQMAVEYSGLSLKIKNLEEGLETFVGNNGVKLSGGERQRVAIARAIYRDPEIFFMDEATSALDSKTEEKIIQNLQNNFRSKTKILIAHRETSLKKCDDIKTLENGTIK